VNFPTRVGKKKLGSIDSLLKRTRKTGTIVPQPDSGRPRSMHSDENIKKVEDIVLSQEDKPKTHRSIPEISHETGILHSSVHRIIHRDLQLKCFQCRAHVLFILLANPYHLQ